MRLRSRDCIWWSRSREGLAADWWACCEVGGGGAHGMGGGGGAAGTPGEKEA